MEYATAAALEKAGFRALQGRTYRDSSGKRRDIDVLATALLTAKAPALMAVAECKHAVKPWIVRQTFIPGPELAWTPIAHPAVVRGLAATPWILAKSLPFGSDPALPHIGFAVVQAEKGEDVAFGALSQAVSAARGVIDDLPRRVSPAMALPVVVIDKPLLTLAYAKDGSEVLTSVPWSRVLWSALDEPTVIDVVTLASIDNYAMNLRHELGDLAETIEVERVPFHPGPSIA